MSWENVLSGEQTWSVVEGDAIACMDALPKDSVDLCFFSPPYTGARLYLEHGEDLGIARDAETWARWMVEVFTACHRVCKGLVACVCEGQTKSYRWDAAPALLLADLHRAGFNLRRPCLYHRVGIPGSGGPDWLRADVEYIICTTRPGRLPWSDTTACGHPPKWAPGGAMSNRMADGSRVNEDDPWDKHGRGNHIGGRRKDGSINKDTKWGCSGKRSIRLPNGKLVKQNSVSEMTEEAPKETKGHTKTRQGTDTREQQSYSAPVLANPGNVITCKVGGGRMGSPLAHENEAPFPEELAAFFVRSFCPPDGIVLDCFAGSGTTGAVSRQWQRRFLGCDLRASQVELSRRRIEQVTPDMFAGLKEVTNEESNT